MMTLEITPIGTVSVTEEKALICLKEEFHAGLEAIEGFSHLIVIWWAHLTDQPEARKRILTRNLFKLAPPEVGVFASRTPERPNPIMISTIKVDNVDYDNGIIITSFVDAEDGTPVLDIKPYFPVERIRNCKTPSYYNHWPQWHEDSADFNWKNEISFNSL